MERMKILVIDDNTVNLATVEQALKDNYDVFPMLTGRRAINFLYKEKVDLILLDVQMPIMDGIETLKEIRTQSNGVTVPVIFLTAQKDPSTVVEGSKLGIMDYITKPFDALDLQERINKALKRIGRLPITEQELYDTINDIYKDVQLDKIKPAFIKTKEVLNYQTDEEINGRIKSIKNQLEIEDIETAKQMLERLLKMMERNMNKPKQEFTKVMSNGEISAKLLFVLDKIDNFKVKEACSDVKELLKRDLPIQFITEIKRIGELLERFDDEAAIKEINSLLGEIKKAKQNT